MKTMRAACVAGLVLTMAAAGFAQRRPGKLGAPERPGKKQLTPVAKSTNDFAAALYEELSSQKGNLFFSPSSIHTALAMTYAGARGNTEKQMSATLRFPLLGGAGASPQDKLHGEYAELLKLLKPPKEGGYQLSVANALWGQKGYPWIQDFLDTTEENYGAGLRQVDFVGATEKSRQAINLWVEDQTNEKIKDLIPQGVLDALTRLVLTNAIYFKGDWASQFKESATKDAPFKLGGDKTVKAPLMYQKGKFAFKEDGDVQVLSMPYKGDDLSMVVVLPRKVDGLADVTANLTAAKIDAWTTRLYKRDVQVFLPKFKVESQFGLSKVLAKMGMSDAFNPSKADLSGMNGKRDLYISAVIHKAYVDVNEEGTEAAAATAVVVSLRSARPRPQPVFRADHPFLFLIRHNKTGAVLFMGRLASPKK